MQKIIPVLVTLLVNFSSYDIYSQWYFQNQSFTKNSLNAVKFIDSSIGWVVGDSGVILNTINGGQTWESQISGTDKNLYGLSFTDENTGTAVGYGGVILHTTNSGQSWFSQVSGTSDVLRGVSFVNSDVGTVVGQYGAILRTTNGGSTWFPQTPDILGLSFYDVCFTNSTTGTAVGFDQLSGSLILRTTDSGANWFYQSTGTVCYLFGISFLNHDTGIVTGRGLTHGAVFLTTNGGATWWNQITDSSTFLREVEYASVENITAVGENGIIIRSTNQGITWEHQTSGTALWLLGVSFVDSYNGWIVGEDGLILHTSNGGITFIEETEDTQQKEFYLSQNYPNPFNPTTKIKYTIPALTPSLSHGERVILQIIDVLGREVATLINEEKPAGSYEVEYDASHLASGIYFYKLNAGNFVATKKMVLLR